MQEKTGQKDVNTLLDSGCTHGCKHVATKMDFISGTITEPKQTTTKSRNKERCRETRQKDVKTAWDSGYTRGCKHVATKMDYLSGTITDPRQINGHNKLQR